jgi:hypothetical protein
MFDRFMTQKLKLKKKSGEIFADVSASVQKKIYINDIKLPVEEGDIFEYVLPSGLKQRLLVTRVTLYNFGSPMDHYEVDYVKD